MLRAIPSAKLDGTSLSRTWILHESLRPTFPRLVGGVRADDGWLGVQEVLPRVVIPGASAVALNGRAGEVSLTNAGDDTWVIPAQDLAGEFTVVASLDGAEYRRTIRFYQTPASEAFKPPSDPEAWIVRADRWNGYAGELDSVPNPAVRSTIASASPNESRISGRTLARSSTNSSEAAWRVSRFAGRLLGSRGLLRGQAAVPSNQVVSAHARRRWRKMLFESAAWLDPDFDE